jgi:hypothetical protein
MMLAGSLGRCSIPEFLSGHYFGAGGARPSRATLTHASDRKRSFSLPLTHILSRSLTSPIKLFARRPDTQARHAGQTRGSDGRRQRTTERR